MTRFISIIITLYSLFGCDNSSEVSIHPKLENKPCVVQSEFMNVVSKMDIKQFPDTIYCSGDFVNETVEIPPKFYPENDLIGFAGKYLQTDSLVGLVFLYPADVVIPSFAIYNHSGKLLKNTLFFQDHCNGDESFRSSAYSIIDSNFNISTQVTEVFYENDTITGDSSYVLKKNLF